MEKLTENLVDRGSPQAPRRSRTPCEAPIAPSSPSALPRPGSGRDRTDRMFDSPRHNPLNNWFILLTNTSVGMRSERRRDETRPLSSRPPGLVTESPGRREPTPSLQRWTTRNSSRRGRGARETAIRPSDHSDHRVVHGPLQTGEELAGPRTIATDPTRPRGLNPEVVTRDADGTPSTPMFVNRKRECGLALPKQLCIFPFRRSCERSRLAYMALMSAPLFSRKIAVSA